LFRVAQSFLFCLDILISGLKMAAGDTSGATLRYTAIKSSALCELKRLTLRWGGASTTKAGGRTLNITELADQAWFGHRARSQTPSRVRKS
jgi:hypothetical protein